MTISRVVFRFDLVVDSAGTEATYYASTHGFTTKPTDSPASTYIEESVAKGGAGSYRRDLFSGARVAGGSAPSFGVIKLDNTDGRLDDFARYAAAGGTVRCYYGDDSMSFPAGYWLVYVSRISQVFADFETITIRQKDRAELLRTPIVTATFAGSGGLEGPAGGPSRKKQMVFGRPGLVPPILIDSTKQIYYLQANATDVLFLASLSSFGRPFEGGVPILYGGILLDVDDVLNVEPEPGTYRICFGTYNGNVNSQTQGQGYLRLGTPPTADLRFGPSGYLQNDSITPPRPWRFTDLCNRAGLNDITPSTIASIVGPAENFDAGNRLVEGDQTYEALFNDRATALNGAWGFNERDQFYCVTLADPTAGSGSSVYTFTNDNADEFARSPIAGMERPVWQVNVKAGRAFPATPLEGASEEMHDLLTREGYLVQFSGSASAIKDAYPQAISVSIEIDGHDFETQAQRVAFIEQFGALYGTLRDFVSLKCKRFDTSTLAITLHDKVTLQIPRFDYDAGVLFRVVTIDVNLDDPSISFVLWGNNSGFAAWSLGGGAFPAGAGNPGGSWGPNGPPNGMPTIEDLTSTFADFDIEFYAAPLVEAAASFEFEDFEVSSDSTISAPADPDFASVALLLHFDGTNGSTTITDSSSYADSKTSASPIVLTTSDSVWGGSCLITPSGTSSGAAGTTWSPGNARFARASGVAYTIECWFKKTGANTQGTVAKLRIAGGGGTYWDLTAATTTDRWTLTVGSTSTNVTLTTGVWHFCQTVVNTSNIATTKIDGTTVQTTSALSPWTGTPYVVLAPLLTVSSGDLLIDDLRITPGVARAFAVPTAAFPDS